jgi:hypothetical protein
MFCAFARLVGLSVVLLLCSSVSPAQQEGCRDLDKTHRVCFYQMKELPSGGGKWFSPEYTIGPSTAPEGWVLEHSQFDLVSYHHCHANDFDPVSNEPGHPFTGHPTGQGYFSECWSEQRTPTSIVWRFRFQGLEKPLDKDASTGMPILGPAGSPLVAVVNVVVNLPRISFGDHPINIPGVGVATFLYRKIDSPSERAASITPAQVKHDLKALKLTTN